MKKIIAFFSFLIFSATSTVAFANKEQLFVERLKEMAESGNATAQSHLGILYYNGGIFGIEKDYNKSFDLFSKAAEKNDIQAQNMLGMMYQAGQGTSQDYNKSLYYFQKSAENNDKFGQFSMGMIYLYGYGVPQNFESAIEWFKKSAQNGYKDAQLILEKINEAENLSAGKSRNFVELTKKDQFNSLKDGHEQSKNESVAHQYNTGMKYLTGDGVDVDFNKAAYWLEKAVNQQHADAQHALGMMHLGGDGVDKNIDRGLSLISKASDQGLAGAQTDFGMI